MQRSLLKSFQTPREIAAWAVFLTALAFYWITCDPDVSYWDCPEYVVSASRLEIGHPPGNPIWMLAMRVATIPFPSEYHAYVINLCSGVLMAFAAFFLCRIIFILVFLFLQKSFHNRKSNITNSHTIIRSPHSRLFCNILATFISYGASLSFALCDSTWFSAVEAEVYAMSTFLAALSLWVMVKWWYADSKGKRGRLIFLVAYITGISLGVHQLNLLLIPVFALIIFYKFHPWPVNPLKSFICVVFSAFLIVVILMALIRGLLFAAQRFELFTVNGLGFSFNSGVLSFCVLVALLFLIGLLFLHRYQPNDLAIPYRSGFGLFPSLWSAAYYSLWMLAFIILGFSSFGVILIRSQADPFMNEGTPDNIFSLSSYINREQYPSAPLIYGHTPYSQPLLVEENVDGKPSYTKYALKKGKPRYLPLNHQSNIPSQTRSNDQFESNQTVQLQYRSGMLTHADSVFNNEILSNGYGYVLVDYDFSQKLTPELNMWLPRITSRNTSDRQAYADWAGMNEENMLKLPVSEAVDPDGNYVSRKYPSGNRHEVFSYRPTYGQNLRFFIAYQAYYMYFRYLFWNFIGRQNDFPSTGEIEHGNFITGIDSLDRLLIGNTHYIPDEIGKNNPGRNRYFGIPFLFGFIGIVWLSTGLKRSALKSRILALITLLWFMTGLAIVIYLNQSPGEPRERDYTFLISYMAFSMWIATGILALVFGCLRIAKNIISEANLHLIRGSALVVAFIFSFGLPTLMAIENFADHDRRGRFQTAFFSRSLTDMEVPSLIFSHGDNTTFPLWYATEVLALAPQHTPIDITYLGIPSGVPKKYSPVDFFPQEDNENHSGSTGNLLLHNFIISKIPSDVSSSPMPLKEALSLMYESKKPLLPTSIVVLPSNTGDSVTINLHDFSRGSSYLSFRHLMLLSLLAEQLDSYNPKALYFPALIDHAFYAPLDSILTPALFGKIYAPWLSKSQSDSILRVSALREIGKLLSQDFNSRYIDPVIADRQRRYRGELIIAATELLAQGDTLSASKIADAILQKIPYTSGSSASNKTSCQILLPGDFTIADTTFYEGPAFIRLLNSLASSPEGYDYQNISFQLDSLMTHRHKEWLRYYHSLSPEQRNFLSNRSRRLLIPPKTFY